MRIHGKATVGCFALALMWTAIAPAFAQTSQCAADAEPRRIVVTIGIDHYAHSSHRPPLSTAVNDANCFEQVLQRKFGYQSYESLMDPDPAKQSNPLRDGSGTREAIDFLVSDGLPRVLCSNDDFILFFSGHGEKRAYQDHNIKGYLVPSDAPEQGCSNLIEVKAFLEDISNLPARHILVILDACHSGIAIQDALAGVRASGNYQQALKSHNSRKVIASALADQTASDTGSIPGHSLFGGLLLQALDLGLAAKNSDFIADSDLAEFLKAHVTEENSNQEPDWVPFG
jgi:uncharacterized caspase-like protein